MRRQVMTNVATLMLAGLLVAGCDPPVNNTTVQSAAPAHVTTPPTPAATSAVLACRYLGIGGYEDLELHVDYGRLTIDGVRADGASHSRPDGTVIHATISSDAYEETVFTRNGDGDVVAEERRIDRHSGDLEMRRTDFGAPAETERLNRIPISGHCRDVTDEKPSV